MPGTDGSTLQLKTIRAQYKAKDTARKVTEEKERKQRAKKQGPLNMRAKKKTAKPSASMCSTGTETDRPEEADVKLHTASQQDRSSSGVEEAKQQGGHAAAEAVPSRGLQSATYILPPPVTDPYAACSTQAKASPHQKATCGGTTLQPPQPGCDSAQQLEAAQHLQNNARHSAPSDIMPTAALTQPKPSAASQSTAASAGPIPAISAAAAKPETGASSAQLPASDNPPQQAASASAEAAPPPGASAPVQQQQPDPKKDALQMMVNAGVKPEEGALALAAVPANPENAEEWAMAGIEWMTTQMELRDEIADMDRAMQVSLKEAEQERQKQKTPAEMEEEQLLSHFRGSVLIPKLKESACEKIFLQPPLKTPILALLELEQKTCRWYPSAGTKAFFLRLGEQCKAKAASSADHSPEEARCKRQKRDSTESGHDRIGAPPAFHEFLHTKAEELCYGLYQMPVTSGEVPAIFMTADEGAADNEVTAREQTAEDVVFDGDAIVLD